jgi:hypothetical protein
MSVPVFTFDLNNRVVADYTPNELYDISKVSRNRKVPINDIIKSVQNVRPLESRERNELFDYFTNEVEDLNLYLSSIQKEPKKNVDDMIIRYIEAEFAKRKRERDDKLAEEIAEGSKVDVPAPKTVNPVLSSMPQPPARAGAGESSFEVPKNMKNKAGRLMTDFYPELKRGSPKYNSIRDSYVLPIVRENPDVSDKVLKKMVAEMKYESRTPPVPPGTTRRQLLFPERSSTVPPLERRGKM